MSTCTKIKKSLFWLFWYSDSQPFLFSVASWTALSSSHRVFDLFCSIWIFYLFSCSTLNCPCDTYYIFWSLGSLLLSLLSLEMFIVFWLEYRPYSTLWMAMSRATEARLMWFWESKMRWKLKLCPTSALRELQGLSKGWSQTLLRPSMLQCFHLVIQ